MKFGTGGWRAIIADEFTKENVEKIAVGIYMLNDENKNPTKPIVIGYDNRFMSKEASKWLVYKLISFGISVNVFEESVPTPLLMHYVKNNNLNIGLMITASHNPYQYNGIKVIVCGGKDAPVDVTNKLSWSVNNLSDIKIRIKNSDAEIVTVNNEDYYEEYLKDVSKIIDFDKVSKCINSKLFKFDAMYGSAQGLFRYIIKKYLDSNKNIEDYCMHCRVDETFNHIVPAPTKETTNELSKFIVDNNYDFGFAFDGDGDRLGVIDSNGRYYDMNEMLCLFYQYLIEEKHMQGSIVKNCVTTSILDKLAKENNMECINVPVGFKWISSAMERCNALIGGESSGGLTMRGHISGKDSTFSALLLMEMLSDSDKNIMDLQNRLDTIHKKYGTSEFFETSIKYNCDKLSLENYIKTLDKKINNLSANRMDGLKLIDEQTSSWVSVRFSGTEPVIRVMAENIGNSNIKSVYSEIVDDIKKIAK